VGWILGVLIGGAYAVLVLGVAAEPGPWPAVVAGGLFAVLAVAGYAWVQRRPLAWRIPYVLVQLILGFATYGAAGASTGATLLLLLLVVQSVLLLPLPGAIAIAVAVPFVHIGMAWDAGIREGLGTLMAVIFAAVVTWLLRREQQTRQELAAANAQLTRFAAQAEELATTQERNRVARDIHDGLGHHLTVLQMQVRAGRAMLTRDAGRADELFAKAEAQALEALSEVRRSVGALRGPRRGEAFTDAVGRLAEEASVSGPPTSVEIRGEPRPLPPPVEEALYRAAQEGLTNVRKHARATRAQVLLDYRPPARVRVVVGDDGCGASPGPDAGFGLTGLRERLAGLGGDVALDSVPGRGSTLTATVPG
jgi:signal transduction histidine kinase